MSELVKEATDMNLNDLVMEHEALVIDCWAPWCAPCRMIAPAVENLAGKYRGRIAFAKLNTDRNPLTPREYGIMGIPTLLIFKNGELVHRIVGALPENILENEILKALDMG
ncbi:MAG: thioredoxin [Thermoplasmata archaeon]|nr:thioredoxin [Thermoplasmata archaeon]